MAKQIIVTTHTEPMQHFFAELTVGDCCVESVCILDKMIDDFAKLSGDYAPIHTNDEHAQQLGYSQRLLPGFLTQLRFSRLLSMFMPGTLAIEHSIKFEYKKPIYVKTNQGLILNYKVTVSRLSEAMKAVILDLEVQKCEDTFVKGTVQCLMMK